MSGQYAVAMGDRGRLVVPAQLRADLGWETGTHLIFIESPHGVVLTTREQLKELVRADLAGDSLVDQLLADRRAEVARESVA